MLSGIGGAELATRDEARAAKTRLARELNGFRDVKGLGLSVEKDQWAIKVNLGEGTSITRSAIPQQVDGVPVIVRVVGRTVLH
jgi:hypothetical protein